MQKKCLGNCVVFSVTMWVKANVQLKVIATQNVWADQRNQEVYPSQVSPKQTFWSFFMYHIRKLCKLSKHVTLSRCFYETVKNKCKFLNSCLSSWKSCRNFQNIQRNYQIVTFKGVTMTYIHHVRHEMLNLKFSCRLNKSAVIQSSHNVTSLSDFSSQPVLQKIHITG
jgi:hypothetical protein